MFQLKINVCLGITYTVFLSFIFLWRILKALINRKLKLIFFEGATFKIKQFFKHICKLYLEI